MFKSQNHYPSKPPTYFTYILAPLFVIGFFYKTWDVYKTYLILSGNKYCEPLQYPITECDCVKSICREKYSGEDTHSSSSQSCDEATLFGPHQKVVSYTLFGQKIHHKTKFAFHKGVLVNLMLMREVYPGWVMRLYTDIKLEDDPELCEITCNNPDFFFCNVRSLPHLGDVTNIWGTFWRFIPIGDSMVDIFISRDVDSVLSQRERLSTRLWEESNKTFHFIRDSPGHNWPVSAGLWGAKVALFNASDRTQLQRTLLKEGENVTKNGFDDQHALAKVLYQPKYFNVSLAHDSYFCKKYSKTECRPYPGGKGKTPIGGRLTEKALKKLSNNSAAG